MSRDLKSCIPWTSGGPASAHCPLWTRSWWAFQQVWKIYPLPCSHCPAFFGAATKMAWGHPAGCAPPERGTELGSLGQALSANHLPVLPSVGWPGFAPQSASPVSCTQCLPSSICCPARASGTSLLSRASHDQSLPRPALPQQLQRQATPRPCLPGRSLRTSDHLQGQFIIL